jgi:hypothetical protein
VSAISLALVLAAGTAAIVGATALHTARGLRRQIDELHSGLAAVRADTACATAGPGDEGRDAEAGPVDGVAVPAARAVPAAEIRAAIADALAEERERELAEARAFWAAQEARDAAGDGYGAVGPLGGSSGGAFDEPGDEPLIGSFDGGEDAAFEGLRYVPRQPDPADCAPRLDAEIRDVPETGAFPDFPEPPHGEDAQGCTDPADARGTDDSGCQPDRRQESAAARDADQTPERAEQPEQRVSPQSPEETDRLDTPELASARRRHPSHPDFTPTPPAADHQRTVSRLAELAAAHTPLAGVRPGPLGTLDVYVFTDGTTICMTPGHRETVERLNAALRNGTAPVLLGGSGVVGAYALTFGCGDESVYVLADRVIASL